MEAKMAFQRSFLIFNAEDSGFEAGQKPSGHVRTEVRDGNGKLWSAIQNLTSGDGGLTYKLYLIKAGREPGAAVCAGILKLRQNRAELEWGFDPYNVHGSGFGINEFNVFAVLAEYIGRENTRIVCPLAAYRNKGTEWRKTADSLIYSQHNMPHKIPEEENIYPKAENIYPEAENIYPEAENKHNEVVESNYIPPDNMPHENSSEIPIQFHQQYGINMPLEAINQQSEEMPVQTQPQNYNQINQQAMPAQTYQAPVNPDSNCLYMNGNMCGMYVNTRGPNPCDTCHIHTQTKSSIKEEKKGDLDKLKEQLGRNFEQNDPFQSKRSDYKWWKVLNPVNLNNILYQCNIRSPILFNPMVMMAHFKYRHLIIGIFTDRVRKREYVVCGVPGMHMIDRKPFGDMCKWVQAEGSRPKYGGFGYWIVYIDPSTGKILSLK